MYNGGRDFVMPFGKYKGQTLEEIYIEDRGYLDWCIDTIDNQEVKAEIQECYRQMKKVRIFH